MSNRLAGESERSRLIERMREDIQNLQQGPPHEHISQHSIKIDKSDLSSPLKPTQMIKYSTSGATLPRPASTQ